MKIGFFELEGWEEELFRRAFSHHDLQFSPKTLEFAKDSDYDVLSIFVHSRVDEKLLARFPKVRFIATRSTGCDHIESSVCKERGIAIANVAFYAEQTVAEYAFGLLLCLTRKLYPAIYSLKKGDTLFSDDLRGIDLAGKTVGIIGLGHIGKPFASMAKAFGMRVLAHDVVVDSVFAKAHDVEYVGLDELLKNSDVVTLHCPLTKKTHHLINEKNSSLFKKGAYLVNTARGSVIETSCLIKGLEEGIFAGIALDVLEEEEVFFEQRRFSKKNATLMALQNQKLVDHPRVLVTAHNAFNSKEALQKAVQGTIENIEAFIASCS